MTQNRKTTAAVCLAVLLGALAFLAGGWIGDTMATDVTPPATTQPYAAPQTAQDGLGALPGSAGTEALSSSQQSAAEMAADRVCEGRTAGVPEGFMVREIAAEGGMTLEDAHMWVEQVLATRCGA